MRIAPAKVEDGPARLRHRYPTSFGRKWLLAAPLALLAPLCAESPPAAELRQILERVERLERANQQLREEVRSLRTELSARAGRAESPAESLAAPVEERVEVVESRVQEQAQTKVETSQRLPIRLTGMALFNAYLNSRNNNSAQYPTVAVAGSERNAGGTLRQTSIGLDYGASPAIWGGKVSGSVVMDFLGGTGQSLDQSLRLRTGTIAMDWASRRIAAGVDKPIFAPRDPTSLAQVGVSPLTSAGNLWLWIPQVRFEQELHLGEASGLRAQVGVVQTRENYSRTATAGYTPDVPSARPGLEGRFEFHHGSSRRIEIAPGFHVSTSHVAYLPVPSRVVSLDWFANPFTPLEFSGAFFTGQNVAPLGAGGAGPGFTALSPADIRAVHSTGGWAQLTYRISQRLSFNFFSGQHDNRDADLQTGMVGKNLLYGTNFFYRLAPNVILSLETSQVRTHRTGTGSVLNNHYDLALAYLF
jgi:hypothetical protein